MKATTLISLLALLAPQLAPSQTPPNRQGIENLRSVLRDGGSIALLGAAKAGRVPAPRIPSQWHVVNRVRLGDARDAAITAREFGLELATHLQRVAAEVQSVPTDAALAATGHHLCDLMEWCAGTKGYGNLLLAQRSLDIAAVALARLTATLEYPFDECRRLAARMEEVPWMGGEARRRTLNDDAGTELFPIGTPLERTWGSGGFLMRERRANRQRPEGVAPGRGFFETEAILANLDFFERDPEPTAVTLLSTWNVRRYERIVNGLELQNVEKALALLRFRDVIGAFPEKVSFSEEYLRKRDMERAQYAKMGIRVGSMYDGMVPGAAAFMRAWNQRQNKVAQEDNLDARAWQAYSEVKGGMFLDQDARAERIAKEIAAPRPNTN